MKQFNGFPDKMEFAPIPSLFFSALLPQIDDMAELKTTLYALVGLYRKRGYPRFVTYTELLGNVSLMSSLKRTTESPDKALRSALEKASERGILIHMKLDMAEVSEDVYFLNTESDKEVARKIQSGELELGGMKVARPAPVVTEEMPDIFALYEENIGMLTPMIAEELRAAEKLYPQSWLRDAIKEAVNHNKRKWSYISTILEHWSAEGKSDGTYQRDSKTDSDKYIKGKYGHMVRR